MALRRPDPIPGRPPCAAETQDVSSSPSPLRVLVLLATGSAKSHMVQLLHVSELLSGQSDGPMTVLQEAHNYHKQDRLFHMVMHLPCAMASVSQAVQV